MILAAAGRTSADALSRPDSLGCFRQAEQLRRCAGLPKSFRAWHPGCEAQAEKHHAEQAEKHHEGNELIKPMNPTARALEGEGERDRERRDQTGWRGAANEAAEREREKWR